jgi:hypothetical protein
MDMHIPQGLLEKHAQNQKKRRATIVAVSAAAIMGILLFFAAAMGGRSGNSAAPKPLQQMVQPAAMPSPAEVPPQKLQANTPPAIAPVSNETNGQPLKETTPIRPPGGPNVGRIERPPSPDTQPREAALVYVVGSGSRYHKATCQHYRKGTGERGSMSVQQAQAAGYTPCKVCTP